MIPELTVKELKDLIDENANIKILDVRRHDEHEICHISDCLIPLDELETRIEELDPAQKTIVHCRSGGRSAQAVKLLQSHGFREVYNLKGGIRAWAEEVNPKMKMY